MAALVALDPQPDAVLLTGDLTDDGDPRSYARVRELLAPLAVPVHPIPGNHDDRDALREAFADHPGVVPVGSEPFLDRAGQPLGYVTSAGYGATVAESIAYGYLPIELAEPGTALAVHSAGADHRVTVVSEPRFDPEMSRLKDVATAAR